LHILSVATLTLTTKDAVSIEAQDLVITSPEGKVLAGPLNFTLPADNARCWLAAAAPGKVRC
jgi:ATP-binding cassette subfamily C protein CydD